MRDGDQLKDLGAIVSTAQLDRIVAYFEYNKHKILESMPHPHSGQFDATPEQAFNAFILELKDTFET